MVIYRQANPEDRAQCTAFADMVFTAHQGPVSFEEILPKMYSEDVDGASAHCIAEDDEKGIRGMVAVMPDDLYAGGKTLKTGFLGTVSVHPDARGEGHMKRLMNMWNQKMMDDGLDLALLHGARQRYAYFGYAGGGKNYKITVEDSNVRHALSDVNTDGIAFEEVTEEGEQSRRAYAWFAQKKYRFARSEAHFLRYCRTYLHRLWTILKDGKSAGYLVCNAENNEIDEWALASPDLTNAVVKGWMQKHSLKCLTLNFPEWEKDVLRHLGSYAEDIHVEQSLRGCVYHAEKVARVLLGAKSEYAHLADGRLCIECEGERFTIFVENGAVRTQEGGENPIVLSRSETSEMYFSLFDYDNRPETPDGWFPLPLYAASPDCF